MRKQNTMEIISKIFFDYNYARIIEGFNHLESITKASIKNNIDKTYIDSMISDENNGHLFDLSIEKIYDILSASDDAYNYSDEFLEYLESQ